MREPLPYALRHAVASLELEGGSSISGPRSFQTVFYIDHQPGQDAVSDFLDRLKAALSNRYAIQKELGAGGTATVYLAEDQNTIARWR